MTTNKVGIIGQGFVGTAVREGLKQHFTIETYDIIPINDEYVLFMCLT